MNEERVIPVDDGEVTYSQGELQSKALSFLKRNKPSAFKQMSDSQRQEYASQKAIAARNYAESLMASGDPSFVAWPKAIRSAILESESD